MKYCPHCGSEARDNATMCPVCRKPISNNGASVQPAQRPLYNNNEPQRHNPYNNSNNNYNNRYHDDTDENISDSYDETDDEQEQHTHEKEKTEEEKKRDRTTRIILIALISAVVVIIISIIILIATGGSDEESSSNSKKKTPKTTSTVMTTDEEYEADTTTVVTTTTTAKTTSTTAKTKAKTTAATTVTTTAATAAKTKAKPKETAAPTTAAAAQPPQPAPVTPDDPDDFKSNMFGEYRCDNFRAQVELNDNQFTLSITPSSDPEGAGYVGKGTLDSSGKWSGDLTSFNIVMKDIDDDFEAINVTGVSKAHASISFSPVQNQFTVKIFNETLTFKYKTSTMYAPLNAKLDSDSGVTNVYDCASDEGDITDKLDNGVNVICADSYDLWYLVEYNGKMGFISGENITSDYTRQGDGSFGK